MWKKIVILVHCILLHTKSNDQNIFFFIILLPCLIHPNSLMPKHSDSWGFLCTSNLMYVHYVYIYVINCLVLPKKNCKIPCHEIHEPCHSVQGWRPRDLILMASVSVSAAHVSVSILEVWAGVPTCWNT